MKTGLYLALFILISAFLSCKKDDDAPPARSTRYQLLTSHYWRGIYFDGMVITDSNSDSIIDTLYNHYAPDSCEMDDRFYFNDDGSILFDPYTITCGEITESVPWSLSNNDTELLIGIDSYQIISMTSSQIRLGNTTAHSSPYYLEVDTVTFVYP